MPDLASVDRNIRQISAIERSWQLPSLPDTVKLDLAAMPGVTPDSVSMLLEGLNIDFTQSTPVPEFTLLRNQMPPSNADEFQFGMRPVQRGSLEQFQNFAAGVGGQMPPEELNADAVKLFKLRAINEGYMEAPADGIITNAWSPDLNIMSRTMMFDDRDRAFRGERPGSIPAETALRLLNDWTSPTGLLSAAADLGVFWNFGQISKEFSTWGDKWRKVNDATNPLDFATSLLDATLGPLDDIVMPVLNVALIVGGFVFAGPPGGAAAAGVTTASTAIRVGRAASMARNIYNTGRRGLAPLPISQIRQPSWTAQRLMGTSRPGTVAQKSGRYRLGSAMTTWRDFKVVARTKQVTGVGMRAGFVSQAQSLLPSYEAQSLGSLIPGLGAAAEGLGDFGFENPIATPFELAFAPYNIFNPGTFLRRADLATEGAGILSRAGTSLIRAGGTVPGRAVLGGVAGGAAGSILSDFEGIDPFSGALVGAVAAGLLPVYANSYLGRNPMVNGMVAGSLIGGGVGVVVDDVDPWAAALAGGLSGAALVPASSSFAWLPNPGRFVGFANKFFSQFNYRLIGQDQRISGEFNQVYRAGLQETDPAALARYDDLVRERGSVQEALAIMNGFVRADGTPDLDQLYGVMTSYTVAGGIDMIAGALTHGGRRFDEFDETGKTAFLGVQNRLLSQIRPITVDTETETLLQTIAMMRARSKGTDPKRLAKEFAREYQQLSTLSHSDLQAIAIRHNENGRELVEQMHALILMDIDQANTWLRTQQFVPTSDTTIGFGASPMGFFSQYLMGAGGGLDTLSDWQKYVRASQFIDDMTMNTTVFNNLVLKSWKNAAGNSKQTKHNRIDSPKFLDDVNDALQQQAFNLGGPTLMGDMLPNPFATGKITAARLDTLTKQDYLSEIARIDELIQVAVAVKSSDNIQLLRSAEQASQQQFGLSFVDLSPRQLNDLMNMNVALDPALLPMLRAGQTRTSQLPDWSALGGKKQRYFIRSMQRLMRERGLSADDVIDGISSYVRSTADDADLWAGFGLRGKALSFADDGRPTVLEGLSALQHRRKELRRKANLTAAEIDAQAIAAKLPPGQAQDEFLQQVAGLQNDGYKLVFGVDFQSPLDIAHHSRLFEDIGVRELNAITLGNFFGRRQPPAARANQERLEQLALVEKLNEFGLGVLAPDDPKIKLMLIDLRRIMAGQMDNLADRMVDYETAGLISKLGTRYDSSTVPRQLADLAGFRTVGGGAQRLTKNRLAELGWSPTEVDAMIAALPKMREAEFKDLGFYSFEAKMRQRNELTQFLKFIRGSAEDRGSLVNRQNLSIAAGGAVGANMNEDNALTGGLAGAAVGLAGGGLAARALNTKGLLNGKILSSQSHTGWMLSDRYVRMRDTLRFTLSPIFDLSRYTEGLVLSQTAAPRQIKTGAQAGQNVVLPLNMSPRAIRKRMMKEKGLTAQEATEEFNIGMANFKQAARGDFDPEVLDSTGRWFQDIGMLGFNPTKWMSGAFMEFINQGMSAPEAYRAARGLYTYGVGGRSAAELTVNMVFFPFSFQKKAFGAVAKWLNDDLARSILLTDSLKTYELLDQQYNLSDFWSDYMPVLAQLQRLNLFAYGISLGRFGGINSQLIETSARVGLQAARDVSDPEEGRTRFSTATDVAGQGLEQALFAPLGLAIRNQEDALKVQALIRQVAPLINDINWMARNVREYQLILTSPTHQGRYAQVQSGYEEWNEYRRQLGQWLASNNLSWSDLSRKRYLEDANVNYRLKRLELERKYPEWKKSRQESIYNAQLLDMERQAARVAVQGGEPTAVERMFVEFENEVDQVKDRLRYEQVFIDGDDEWLDAPAWSVDYLRDVATNMWSQDRRFQSVWEKFYQREFGPLMARK
jgi:hypothetical protein